jgi:hypothetical protein
VSLIEYFIKQLRNVCIHLNPDYEVHLELLIYDEEIVSVLEKENFEETGGGFSEELQLMVHHFVYQNPKENDAMVDLDEVEEEDDIFEVVDMSTTSIPDTNMQNLIENLFGALHRSTEFS